MNECPELVLDGGSSIGQQIEGQIRRLVLSGALRPGEELPTVRGVAVGLTVNPHVVEQCEDFLQGAAERGYSFAAVLHTLQACCNEEVSS
jgi:hypothetical protein